ncbi:MAG: hypothetical protein JWM74_4441 [Myxococcaceae bacterium]|nr:hypothetical protein [Myxococcaceae bacterium]
MASAILGGVLACGSFGEVTTADGAGTASADGGADAVTSDAEPADADAAGRADAPAPFPARRCKVGAPFVVAPTVVPIGALAVEAVRFDPLQKSAYASTCPPAGPKSACDLSFATVTPNGFASLAHYAGSETNKLDSHPMASLDGTFFVFASDRSGAPRIYGATGVNGTFTASPALITLMTTPNGTSDANEPYLLANGRTLYFSAAPSGSSDYDLFRAEGPTVGTFGAGRLLTNVTNVSDVAPVVAEDELEMFWASDRPDGATTPKGALDVWTATRKTTNNPWEYPAAAIVPILNTAEVDYPTWLSPDACDLYLIHKATTALPGELRVAHRN